MKKVLRWSEGVENFILVATFIVMTLMIFIQVLNRNIFQISLPWLEEISLYSMIYLVMFGVEAGLRDGSQIRVTAFSDRIPRARRWMVEMVVKVCIVIFSILMVWYSATIVWIQMGTGQSTPVLHMPMWVPYASFPLVFAVVSVVHVVGIVRIATSARERETYASGIDEQVQEGLS